MKKLLLLLITLVPLLGRSQTDSILVLSDVHLDMSLKPAKFYHVDTDTALFLSAVTSIGSKKFPFIIMPGDLLPHKYTHSADSMNITFQYIISHLQNSDPDAVIIPALGNNDCQTHNTPDSATYSIFYNSALKRIDADSSIRKTFKSGGYYAYNKGSFSIIVLNSLLFSYGPDTEAEKELTWFEQTLKNDLQTHKQVWIVYHIPPGTDRYSGQPSWHSVIQQKYLDIVKSYASIIKYQIGGHTHMNDCRLITAGKKLVSIIDIAPGLDTRNGNNPAYQILHYNAHTKTVNRVNTYYTNATNQYMWSSFSFRMSDVNFLLHFDPNSQQGKDFVTHYSTNRGPIQSSDGKYIAWNTLFVFNTIIEVK